MKITKIEQQKKDARRYAIFLDGEFAFGLHESLLLQSGLHTGDTITGAEVGELKYADEEFRAKEAAYTLLQYRERSVAELRGRLRKKGYPGAVVASVLETLEEKGYLNDREFALKYAEDQLTRKNIGPIRLRTELAKKQVGEAIIDQVVEEIYQKYDVMELAVRAARKKIRILQGKDYETSYRRLTGYLNRRGFSWDVISQVVQQELNN